MANAHGDANSDASIQNASHVTGANSVTVISGGDTNITGSQISGKQIAADVGGSLNITSVQDVTNSAAHQSSTGGGFTISQGGGSASFSAQNGHADSNYAGVNEQASLAMQGIANGLNAIIGVGGGVPPAASPGAVLVNGAGQVLAAGTASSASTITGADNGYGTLSKSPNPEMRDNANASGTYVDPLSNEVKQADGRLAADHILPQNWIKQQEGFDLLTPAQQSELLNDPMNTQGLPSSFNSSKGAKMPGDWTTYKGQPLDPAYVEASAAQAAALKNYITNRINTMLGK